MLNQAYNLLDKEDKKKGFVVVSIVAFQALLEVTGAASIIPLLILFLGSSGQGESETIQSLSNQMYDFGVPRDVEFLPAFIGGLLFLTILTFFVRSYSSYRKNLFVEQTRYSLSRRLLQSYISQPYEYFLQQNASDLSKNLLSEVDQVIGKVIVNLVNMVAHLLVGSAILILLLVINPYVAMLTFLVSGGLYICLYLSVSKALHGMGKERLRRNKERFVIAGEIFGGIKSIKILGKENFSTQKFLLPSYRFSIINAQKQFINEVPAFLVEALGISALIVFTYFSLTNGVAGSTADIVPLLGVYAYSFYKLKPAINSIFVGIAGLRYGEKTIEKLHHDLSIHVSNVRTDPVTEKLPLHETVQFVNVCYKYDSSEREALSGINLTFRAGDNIAIVGSTGSGKSTLMNILLNLLEPTHGFVNLDGERLTAANASKWQNNIGYVSQDIFMMDGSVAENIAFGVPKDEIDLNAVKQAAIAARIDNFIIHSMDGGYDAVVGDRGVRLSGGEKQRIGIARALYTDPDILIFDEATSALDNITEKQIIEEIQSLSRSKKTIIMIAHRLSTVEKCDTIIVLKEGRIETSGSFQELIAGKNTFSAMLNT